MTLKRAAIINGIARFSKIFIQIIVNAVLARILIPEEFGVVAIITVFTTFFNTFADMGFGSAIIQHKDITDDDINSIYSVTIYMGVLLAISFCILSLPISIFYDNEAYLKLGPMLSLSLLFNTFNMIPNAILMREKKFMLTSIRTIIVYLGGGIIAVIFALFDFSYYALVIQTVLIAAITYLWNYLTTKPRFKLKINMNSLRKVAHFSFFQFAFNIINYFSRNLDNLLIGKFLGDISLAYYDKAYSLMLYPVNNLTGVISPVLHPILSDFQNNKKYIYDSYIKIGRILGVLGVYVSGFCLLASRELILLVYGKQWEGSIVCFSALGFVIAVQMINSCSGAILQSLGNTKLLFTSGVINTIITIVMILIGIFIGKSINILSICIAFAYFMHFILAQYIVVKYGFNYSIYSFYKDIKYEIILFIMLIIGCLIYPFNIEHLIISFIVKLIWISVITVVTLLFTKEYRVLTNFIKGGKNNEVYSKII